MPRDLLTAEIFQERLARLTTAKAAAEREYDRAVLDAETGSGSEKAVKAARAAVSDLEARILEWAHRLVLRTAASHPWLMSAMSGRLPSTTRLQMVCLGSRYENPSRRAVGPAPAGGANVC
jgi:hypothetical protein